MFSDISLCLTLLWSFAQWCLLAPLYFQVVSARVELLIVDASLDDENLVADDWRWEGECLPLLKE
jgi:hypothetical protein